MITASEIYWITRLDNFITIIGVTIAIFALAILLLAGFLLAEFINDEFKNSDKDDLKRPIKYLKVFISITILLIITLVLTPTAKEAIAIYAIPKIANNERVIGIGEKGLGILEAELTEWLEDLRENNNE